jgi:hypothetical protein
MLATLTGGASVSMMDVALGEQGSAAAPAPEAAPKAAEPDIADADIADAEAEQQEAEQPEADQPEQLELVEADEDADEERHHRG